MMTMVREDEHEHATPRRNGVTHVDVRCEHRDEGESEHEIRHREDDVEECGDHRVGATARVGRDDAEGTADDAAESDGDDGDEDRQTSAVDDTEQQVVPVRVGAEQVSTAERTHTEGIVVHGVPRVERQPRTDDGEHDDETEPAVRQALGDAAMRSVSH